MTGIAFEPLLNDVMIELLAPKHSRERLALDCFVLVAQACRRQARRKIRRLPRCRREKHSSKSAKGDTESLALSECCRRSRIVCVSPAGMLKR